MLSESCSDCCLKLVGGILCLLRASGKQQSVIYQQLYAKKLRALSIDKYYKYQSIEVQYMFRICVLIPSQQWSGSCVLTCQVQLQRNVWRQEDVSGLGVHTYQMLKQHSELLIEEATQCQHSYSVQLSNSGECSLIMKKMSSGQQIDATIERRYSPLTSLTRTTFCFSSDQHVPDVNMQNNTTATRIYKIAIMSSVVSIIFPTSLFVSGDPRGNRTLDPRLNLPLQLSLPKHTSFGVFAREADLVLLNAESDFPSLWSVALFVVWALPLPYLILSVSCNGRLFICQTKVRQVLSSLYTF